MIVVISDLNAKVGNNNANREEVIGNHGERQQRREILRLLHREWVSCDRNIVPTKGNAQADVEVTRWEDGEPDRPCHGEWSHENINTGHESDERSRRI